MAVESTSELQLEQEHVDRAYASLQATRDRAMRLREMVEVAITGGTHQARIEAGAIEKNIQQRLLALRLGSSSLVFGRIDTEDDETFHIGRIAVSSEDQEPLVVDWRAPIAESFYRATGSDPMELTRRRHFTSRGETLVGLEDEVFGEYAGDVRTLQGEGALFAALRSARTGRMGDIVGTVQAEQDEIIRAPLTGILLVQGGPGTGKTVVALHRAAYLLYTHRFPLAGQGVLILGPNRLFLRYIEEVLPSLGEAGAELACLTDLVGMHLPPVVGSVADPDFTAKVKGDARMVKFLRAAKRGRQRKLRETLEVPYGIRRLRVSVEDSEQIIRAGRRLRFHNAGRKAVEKALFEALGRSAPEKPEPSVVQERLGDNPEVREALEWMWPLLTPTQFLRDLFGSAALVRSAARNCLSAEEAESLVRDRYDSPEDVPWTETDMPLIDEVYRLLGPLPQDKPEEVNNRTYGHIVVDEAQDLSPMAIRMVARRSLNGSITLVGDIAQATAPGAVANWEQLIQSLDPEVEHNRAELTVSYRIPAPIMELGARVLTQAEPGLDAPRSVREDGEPPLLKQVDDIAVGVADEVMRLKGLIGDGSIAVVAPEALIHEIADALEAAGIEAGRVGESVGLDQPITLLPMRLIKGVEVDATVVVEPGAMIREHAWGWRALYIAMTRSTQRLSVIHAERLPEALDPHPRQETLFTP